MLGTERGDYLHMQWLRFQKRKKQSKLELEAVESCRRTLYPVHFLKSTSPFVEGKSPGEGRGSKALGNLCIISCEIQGGIWSHTEVAVVA